MATDKPFALHITWTCYGTWLPGDPRGHVSDVLLPEGGFLPKANVPGTPYRQGDELTRRRARERQKGETVYLTAEQALVVAVALCQAARARGWRILRAAIMANHVHVVLMDCPNDGPAVRRILKGTSQAALNDHVGHNQRWWTQGGSDRYKNDWPAIEAAVQYVADQPGMLALIVEGRAAGFTPADESPANESPAGINPANESPAGINPANESPAGINPANESPAGINPAARRERAT